MDRDVQPEAGEQNPNEGGDYFGGVDLILNLR
jgi:hypothetical protein